MPFPECSSHPSEVSPVKVCLPPVFKTRVFFSFFPRALSHTPLSHSLGKPRCPVLAGYPTLCGAQSSRKSVLHCISVCTCRLSLLSLWAPHSQQPLSKPQLSAGHHLEPWTYWWPGSQGPGCMHFSYNRVIEELVAPQMKGSHPSQQKHLAPPPLGRLITCLLPWGLRTTCSLVSSQN